MNHKEYYIKNFLLSKDLFAKGITENMGFLTKQWEFFTEFNCMHVTIVAIFVSKTQTVLKYSSALIPGINL